MIVEVTGTNTWNKGAELMLVAVRAHVAARHPTARLAVNQFFGAYPERAKYGLWQKVALNGWDRSRLALALMPSAFRKAFGLVTEEEVDVLLDASGFAFGDQHPAERTLQFADQVEAAASKGKKVILLPQALGPFEQPALRDAFARIAEAAALVFARDDVSMEHARRAAGTAESLRQAPDFTNLVKPKRAVESDASERVCIVPNQRMVEKAETEEEAAAYVPLIGYCVEAAEEAGLRPVVLLHGRDDAGLAADVQAHLGRALPVHNEDDPVAIKRFLGESHLVIGSRFHALVGALSQGVPAIGTSWSHKYEMLFREYGCEDMLLPVPADRDVVRDRVTAATGSHRATLTEQIRECGEALQERTKDMWKQVDAVLTRAT